MISKEEVQHIAKLARLGLTPEEIAKFQKELSSILAFFEKLKEADVSSIEPASRSIKVENIMRKDEAKRVKGQKLLELAPEAKDGYLKTKPIL